ncbi:MAG: hypothetical protein ABFE01_09245 [Phycisphaerales bacterium]
MSKMNETELRRRLDLLSEIEPPQQRAGRVLDRVRQSLAHASTQPTARSARIWRTIMRSKMTKPAAAAAVILTAVLAMMGDWMGITTPAFGLEEIRKAMKQVEHSHFVLAAEFVDANAVAAMGRRPEGWESWTSRNPPRQIEKHAGGRISCTEEDTGRVFRYDPASNTIVVEQGEPTSPELLQMSMMDRFAK